MFIIASSNFFRLAITEGFNTIAPMITWYNHEYYAKHYEAHDYQVRINQAHRFLTAGDKVKATITFKGREIQHTNLALELLKKMSQDLDNVAEIQQSPSKDGRQIIMILSPK